MTGDLVIDGSFGEGGGQVLRTALTLSAILGTPIRIDRVRFGRPKPGLAAQHLTAVRAAAALCDAALEGADLGSTAIAFAPRRPVMAGDYCFDVGEARPGGSAGAVTLVLQTVIMPLALVAGRSTVTVRGGTHMAWSPSFHFLRDVWLATLSRVGVSASAELRAWGWYPVGRGEVHAAITGGGPLQRHRLQSLDLVDRGELRCISGCAVAANLPAHIPQRMADRATALLRQATEDIRITAKRVRAACPGAGLFLTAHYEHGVCGFDAHGRRGKPSESVAEEAAEALLAHWRSGAAVETHLADQLLVPLAFAEGPSTISVDRVSRHLETNAWLIEQFGAADIAIQPSAEGRTLVAIRPTGPQPAS